MTDSTIFVVLLKNVSAWDIGALAKAIGKISGEIPFEITPRLKRRAGVLASGLDETSAQKFADSLKTLGIDSVLLQEGAYPHLPPPLVASTLALKPDFLTLTIANQEKQVPWSSVSVLAAAAIKTTFSKTVKEKQGPSAQEKLLKTGLMLATGLPLPIGRSKEVEKTVHSSETIFFVDLFLTSESQRVRLPAERFSYGFLGKEKGMTAMENMRLTLRTLAASAPAAVKNPTAVAWLTNQPLALFFRENETEHEEECRWLAVCRA